MGAGEDAYEPAGLVYDGELVEIALAEELRTYPGVSDQAEAVHHSPTAMLFVPLVLRGPGCAELRFFSTVATFGTALDITLAELAIESFFPADEPTAAVLRGR